ncbi:MULTISPECIES: M3 family metallopeptidase [unclassified Pseudomonas]|uniref:M3 family metallopeptidase n=1 Tax=unclassified Pseudomonas TaxID=196821 RepID=UPI0030DA429B
MRHASNPLLQPHVLPPFSEIQAEHFPPALDQIIAESRAQVAEIIRTQTPYPTWDDLVLAMDEIHARLRGFGYVLDRLASTWTADAWEQVSDDCRERLNNFRRTLSQNLELSQLYQRLADSQIAVHFSPARKRTLAKILRRLRPNSLAPDVQAALKDLKLRIRGAEMLFMKHLEEANKAWSQTFDDEARLRGLPPFFKEQMAEHAREKGRTGWLLKLTDESFRIVTRYAEDRVLREQIYIAYSHRASDQGPDAGIFDNGEVLRQLLKDRHQTAILLGYSNYAQLAIEPEQAQSPEQVMSFLMEKLGRQQQVFEQDADQLKTFAGQEGFGELQPWDYQYLAEKIRRQTTGVSEQTASAWFELRSTFYQLLLIAHDLFGIDFTERQDLSTWHAQVRVFEIHERGDTLGFIYFDPFENGRLNGYPHTSPLRNHRITAEGRPRYPVATLHAWLPRGSDSNPVLLDHRHLSILFHEFGHCLHHVLSRADYRDISGISELSRDAAEFAGNLLQRWCLSRQCLLRIARHHQTGAPLPDPIADQLLMYLTTQTSWQSARSLRDALFDMELHRSHGDGRTAQQVFDQISAQVGHLPASANERWPNGLDYMVTGYGAGLYAYIWSQDLAERVFQRFKRNGLFERATGRALRQAIYEAGDSRPLSESIAAFMQATDHRAGART